MTHLSKFQQKWAKLERLIETDETGKYCSQNCQHYGERCGLFSVTQATETLYGHKVSLRVYACCRATGDVE